MSGPAANAQWYLARDGEQFGPISELEMAKLVELGHLKPTDLLWREGFPDWRPAMVVFPPHAPPMAGDQRSTRGGPARRRMPLHADDRQHSEVQRAEAHRSEAHRSETLGAEARSSYFPDQRASYAADDRGSIHPDDRINADETPAKPRRLARVLALVLTLAVLAAAGGAGYYHYRDRVAGLVASFTATMATTPAPTAEVPDVAARSDLEVPPFAGFRGEAAAIDATLQATALWKIVKREFPDWYQQRVDEAAGLAAENKDDEVIGQLMARKLVELRRQHITQGLSATPETLRTMVVAYLKSIDRLRQQNPEACHGFIMQGEAQPQIVAMLQGSEHTAHLQAELTAVFEAIAEGRQIPRVHARPSPEQREMLTTELAKRGWTPADYQTLSSDKNMAAAPAEKVCTLVHDFFTAQLSLPDYETQMRLLVNSVRPIFAVSG